MKQKNVFLVGYYGYRNLGDEAILTSVLNSLRKHRSDLDFCVVSGDPTYTEKSYGVRAILFSDLSAILNEIEKSDLVILGGGGLFQDYWGAKAESQLTRNHAGIAYYSEIPLLAYLLKKPIMIYSVGIGPVISDEGQRMTRLSFDIAQVATLRDSNSESLLRSFGYEKENLQITADPAFLLEPDEIGAETILSGLNLNNGKPIVGVCLRNWDIHCNPDKWQASVAESLDHFMDEHDCNMVFIPFQNLPEFYHTNDHMAAEAVKSRMRNSNSAVIIKENQNPAVVEGIIKRCQLVVGMRLHSLIFAANTGIPVVALAYDPKVELMMNRLGLKQYSINLTGITSKKLYSIMERAWLDKTGIQGLLIDKTKTLKKLACYTSDQAIRLMKSSFSIPTESIYIADYLKYLSLKQTRLLIDQELQIGLLSTQLSAKDRVINTLQQERKSITQNDGIIQDPVNNFISNIQLIQEQSKIISRQQEQIEDLQEGIAQILKSRGWKLLQILWKIRLWLLPHGSKFEMLIIKAVGLTRNLKSLYIPFSIIPRIFRKGYIEEDNSQVTLYTNQIGLLADYSPRKLLKTAEIKNTNIKISLVACIKNEMPSCHAWMQRIKNQTLPPNEVIIVDTGSTDGTLEFLSQFKNNFPIPLSIISAPGKNIAQGRNIGIRNAHHNIIAVTDFGAAPKEDWLEKITYPFRENSQIIVSAGGIEPVKANGKQIKDSPFWIWSTPDKIIPNRYLPGAASLAFKKSAWKSVGGFPEWLTMTAEDTYFDLELKKLGGEWAYVPDAVFQWIAPKNIIESLKKLFYWGVGDGESGIHTRFYWRNAIRLIWVVVVMFLTIIALLAIFVVPFSPSWLWTVSIVVALVIGLEIVGLRYKLGVTKVVQHLFGEAAQLIGFIKGASRRKDVEIRRLASIKGAFFILAGVPMDDTGGGARSSQIAMEFLDQNNSVIYIHKFPKNENNDLNIRFSHPNLFQYSLSEFKFSRFHKEHPGLLLGKDFAALIEFPLAEFLPIIHKIQELNGKIIYDLLDDWQTSLGSTWYSNAGEKEIIKVSDILIATAPILQNRLEKLSVRKVTLVPNAVNKNLFDPTREYPIPDDFPLANRVIAYVGALWGDWFDWDLLGKIAKRYQDAAICIIGDYRGQFKESLPNVFFLGLKPQTQLPAYLYHSDVAFIPWKVNKITQSTSPLKLFEYLAMRLPVVAPDLNPLRGIPGVFLAQEHNGFIDIIGNVDRSKLNVDEVEKFIELNNWKTRVSQILELIAEKKMENDLGE